MRFSFVTLFYLLFVTTVASAARVVESSIRFLEDQPAENDYAFLGNYSLKMIGCDAGAGYSSQYGSEDGLVIFRLCPSSGYCSDDPGMGCDSGYGDYLVGINTFVKAYLEHKGDEIQQLADDNFQIEDLAECRQYNADEDSDYADGVYYVGPTCTADGTGVRMALFSDKDCENLVNGGVTFEDISAGITLPYSDGGLVSQSCESCSSVNDENDSGEARVNEMCLGLYEKTYFWKCETQMEVTTNDWGEGKCDFINYLLLKKITTKSQVGKVLGWSFFVMALVYLTAFAVTAMTKNKKKKRSVMEVDKTSLVMPPID